MVKKTLLANTISCDHCKTAIENGVATLHGVKNVEVNVGDKSITVEFDETSIGLTTIMEKIEETGYTVTR